MTDWAQIDTECDVQFARYAARYPGISDRQTAFQALAERFGLVTSPPYAETVVKAFLENA